MNNVNGESRYEGPLLPGWAAHWTHFYSSKAVWVIYWGLQRFHTRTQVLWRSNVLVSIWSLEQVKPPASKCPLLRTKSYCTSTFVSSIKARLLYGGENRVVPGTAPTVHTVCAHWSQTSGGVCAPGYIPWHQCLVVELVKHSSGQVCRWSPHEAAETYHLCVEQQPRAQHSDACHQLQHLAPGCMPCFRSTHPKKMWWPGITAQGHWRPPPPRGTVVHGHTLALFCPTGFQIIRKKVLRFCRLSITPLSGISSCSAITTARGGNTLRK